MLSPTHSKRNKNEITFLTATLVETERFDNTQCQWIIYCCWWQVEHTPPMEEHLAIITKMITALYSLLQKSHFWESVLQIYRLSYKIVYVETHYVIISSRKNKKHCQCSPIETWFTTQLLKEWGHKMLVWDLHAVLLLMEKARNSIVYKLN